MAFRTPRLVRIEPWEQYLKNSSKRARREYRYAQRAHPEEYREISLERSFLQRWMDVWEEQVVEGKHPKWIHAVDTFFEHKWRVLACDSGIHPLLVCGDYCYAGPPLYRKKETPYAAKFMWFGTIRWCAEQGIKWLDLQGPGRSGVLTWRKLLQEPDKSYKWLYVQPDIRENPDNAPAWISQCCPCGWRQLVVREGPCRGCSPG